MSDFGENIGGGEFFGTFGGVAVKGGHPALPDEREEGEGDDDLEWRTREVP